MNLDLHGTLMALWQVFLMSVILVAAPLIVVVALCVMKRVLTLLTEEGRDSPLRSTVVPHHRRFPFVRRGRR